MAVFLSIFLVLTPLGGRPSLLMPFSKAKGFEPTFGGSGPTPFLLGAGALTAELLAAPFALLEMEHSLFRGGPLWSIGFR